MLNTFTTITVILILLLFLYIGFYAGFIKSFFAAVSGFVATLLAENYPYQEGINYYFVFIATAVVIFIIGIICFKFVKFLYLSLFDKMVGAVLALFLGFAVSANFVIPTIDKTASLFVDVKTKTVKMKSFSSKVLPMFDNYVPGILNRADLSDLKYEFQAGLNSIKNMRRAVSTDTENSIKNIEKDIVKEIKKQ